MLRALAAALLAAAALAGCDASFSLGGDKLDTDKAEREITKGIKDQTGVDAAVVCPEDVDLEAGATFICTATPKTGGRSANVLVTQKDDQGNVSWKLG